MLNTKRVQRAQDRMKQQGMDAYLILTHDDYIYFSERIGISHARLFLQKAYLSL